MKSGMLAAETVFDAVQNNNLDADLESYEEKFDSSWIQTDLYKSRNMTLFSINMERGLEEF